MFLTTMFILFLQTEVLERMEAAFPLTQTIGEIAEQLDVEQAVAKHALTNLKEQELLVQNCDGYQRKTEELDELEEENGSPTIAIITSKYSEKEAVEAMMTNREVHHKIGQAHETKKENERHYCIGKIGSHTVVTMKLPILLKKGRKQLISFSNSITHLLGHFNKVEKTLLVGVCGSIPDLISQRHCKPGNVIIASGAHYKHFSAKGHVKSWPFQDDVVEGIADRLIAEQDSQALQQEIAKVLPKMQAKYQPPKQKEDIALSLEGQDVVILKAAAETNSTEHQMKRGGILIGDLKLSERMEVAHANDCQAYDMDFEEVNILLLLFLNMVIY